MHEDPGIINMQMAGACCSNVIPGMTVSAREVDFLKVRNRFPSMLSIFLQNVYIHGKAYTYLTTNALKCTLTDIDPAGLEYLVIIRLFFDTPA